MSACENAEHCVVAVPILDTIHSAYWQISLLATHKVNRTSQNFILSNKLGVCLTGDTY